VRLFVVLLLRFIMHHIGHGKAKVDFWHFAGDRAYPLAPLLNLSVTANHELMICNQIHFLTISWTAVQLTSCFHRAVATGLTIFEKVLDEQNI